MDVWPPWPQINHFSDSLQLSIRVAWNPGVGVLKLKGGIQWNLEPIWSWNAPVSAKRGSQILDRKRLRLFLMRRVFFVFSDLDLWMVWLGKGDASHYGSRTRLLKSPVLSAHYRGHLIEPDQPKHIELTAAHKRLRGKNTLYMSADTLVLIKNKSKFPGCYYTHEAMDLMIQLEYYSTVSHYFDKLPRALDRELMFKCITT